MSDSNGSQEELTNVSGGRVSFQTFKFLPFLLQNTHTDKVGPLSSLPLMVTLTTFLYKATA